MSVSFDMHLRTSIYSDPITNLTNGQIKPCSLTWYVISISLQEIHAELSPLILTHSLDEFETVWIVERSENSALH